MINASPAAINLDGWRIADRAKQTCPVPGGILDAGATRVVTATDGVTLGNDGGAITLLDLSGIKVHRVAYRAEHAHNEGWALTV